VENRQESVTISSESCRASDLTCDRKGLFLWCLPILAVVAAASWPSVRGWLWIPAFLVMGIACLANAARCGRLHCYFTGPLFILAAFYTVLAQIHLVQMHPTLLLDTVAALALPAFGAEFRFGRYKKR
jgi:hypothetical protein